MGREAGRTLVHVISGPRSCRKWLFSISSQYSPPFRPLLFARWKVMLGHHLAGLKEVISGRTEVELEKSLLEAMAERLFFSSWTVRLARSDGQDHQDHWSWSNIGLDITCTRLSRAGPSDLRSTADFNPVRYQLYCGQALAPWSFWLQSITVFSDKTS
jgi:hypothetical protein